VSGTEIDKKHLIFLMIDDVRERAAQLGQFAGIELTEKDGVLGVIAATFKLVEDLVPAMVIGDVVAHQVVSAGGHRVVRLV